MMVISMWFDAQCKIITNNLIRNYGFVVVAFSRNLYFLFVYSILRTLAVMKMLETIKRGNIDPEILQRQLAMERVSSFKFERKQ